MKKLLITFVLIFALTVALASCELPFGGTGDGGGADDAADGRTELVKDGSLVLFSDTNKLNEKMMLEDFAEALGKKTGAETLIADSADEASIIYSFEKNDKASFAIGYVRVLAEGGKLYMTASDALSMEYAEGLVLGLAKDGSLATDSSLNTDSYIDLYSYREGKTVLYTEDELDALALLSEVEIDSVRYADFSPDVTEYNVGLGYNDPIPTLSAEAISKSARVEMTQATSDNTTASITVESAGVVLTYTFNFFIKDGEVLSSVVNPGGKSAVVTFVIDDGTVSTAERMLTYFEKYDSLTASFGVKTNALATPDRTTDEFGNAIWQTDSFGKYTYLVNEERVEFWSTVLATGQAELLSHSHTHRYWGDNDDGGSFVYTLNDGTVATSEVFPKGNVTMELLFSKQVLNDLFGEESYGFVKPGVGAKLSQYYYDLLRTSGWYLGARRTDGSGNLAANVNYSSYFKDFTHRFDVKAYMIEHFDSNKEIPTARGDSNEDCLAAGIKNWTDQIDLAIEGGGWACYCIHEIMPDDHVDPGKTAHYIFETQADALFSYADSLSDDILIATFDDASRYYFAWAESTPIARISGNERITVTLESDDPDERLDVPLTVKVEIPDSWAGVTLRGDALDVIEDESGRYVYLDVSRGEELSLERIFNN